MKRSSTSADRYSIFIGHRRHHRHHRPEHVGRQRHQALGLLLGQDVAAASDDLAGGRVGHILAQRPADELLAHLLDAADNAPVGPVRSLVVADVCRKRWMVIGTPPGDVS